MNAKLFESHFEVRLSFKVGFWRLNEMSEMKPIPISKQSLMTNILTGNYSALTPAANKGSIKVLLF